MCQILLLHMTPYSYAMHAKFVLMHRIIPYFVLYEVLILLPFVKKKMRTILVLHFFLIST